jgi:hypothetical protein
LAGAMALESGLQFRIDALTPPPGAPWRPGGVSIIIRGPYGSSGREGGWFPRVGGLPKCLFRKPPEGLLFFGPLAGAGLLRRGLRGPFSFP